MSKLNNFTKFKLEGLETVNGGTAMEQNCCVFTCCEQNGSETNCSDKECDV